LRRGPPPGPAVRGHAFEEGPRRLGDGDSPRTRTCPDDIDQRGIDLLRPAWPLLDLTPQGLGEWYAGLHY
jgi:hypothetical protein